MSLLGNHYQVDAALVGQRVELVFDPFDLTRIDVRVHGPADGRRGPAAHRPPRPPRRPVRPGPRAGPGDRDRLPPPGPSPTRPRCRRRQRRHRLSTNSACPPSFSHNPKHPPETRALRHEHRPAPRPLGLHPHALQQRPRPLHARRHRRPPRSRRPHHLVRHRSTPSGVITGEVGAGKTVAARAALAGLDASRHTIIYIGNPAVGARGIYAAIIAALGGTPRFHKAALIPQAQDALAAERDERGKKRRGRRRRSPPPRRRPTRRAPPAPQRRNGQPVSVRMSSRSGNPPCDDGSSSARSPRSINASRCATPCPA